MFGGCKVPDIADSFRLNLSKVLATCGLIGVSLMVPVSNGTAGVNCPPLCPACPA